MKKGNDKYRVLAVAIIKSAIIDEDWEFFQTEWYQTLATLAYGEKANYITPEEIIKIVMDQEHINNRSNNGQKSKLNY